MEQFQVRAKGFGQLGGDLDHSGSGVGEINGGDDGSHGISSISPAAGWCKDASFPFDLTAALN
jgi:hypothetical protein